MSVQLLPRLTALGVLSILAATEGSGPTPARSRQCLINRAAMLSFAASGGHRSEDAAVIIGSNLRKIAVDSGFPDNTSMVARSKFDHEAAIYLASARELDSGEALRDDVWSYLASVVVPDIVNWRFPGLPTDRYQGGVRNAIQRLWMRGRILDRGERHADRWGLVRGLTEDAEVGIFERPSISGNRVLAMAVAEGWLRMAKRVGRPAMQPVMRRFTKRLRLRNEVIDIAGLKSADVDAIVDEIFQGALS
jgi:hypothetical protein